MYILRIVRRFAQKGRQLAHAYRFHLAIAALLIPEADPRFARTVRSRFRHQLFIHRARHRIHVALPASFYDSALVYVGRTVLHDLVCNVLARLRSAFAYRLVAHHQWRHVLPLVQFRVG